MKEENKKFLKDIFCINVDDYDNETLEKGLELIEVEKHVMYLELKRVLNK